MPETRNRTPLERFNDNPTRQNAISAFCFTCIVDPGSGNGTWTQQTEACASEDCPLWLYRPISRPKRADSSTRQPVQAAGEEV